MRRAEKKGEARGRGRVSGGGWERAKEEGGKGCGRQRRDAQRRSVLPMPRLPVSRCLGLKSGTCLSASPFFAVNLPDPFMARFTLSLARLRAFAFCSLSLYALPASSRGTLWLRPRDVERSRFVGRPSTSMLSPLLSPRAPPSTSIELFLRSRLLPRASDIERARFLPPMLSSKPSSSRCSSMLLPRAERSPRRPAPTVRGITGWLRLLASSESKRSVARLRRMALSCSRSTSVRPSSLSSSMSSSSSPRSARSSSSRSSASSICSISGST
mmetsp:Transcript_10831/g.21762  ORF Transcript_10831/g.21762 Transcript_10831/m.21762 type:complete len:271 (-) Transcript_10831:938-1750(-)